MGDNDCKTPREEAKNVWLILSLLGRHGSLPFSRLMELTRLKKATLGKTLVRMKGDMLVRKKESDNRKSPWCLAECGRKIWTDNIKRKGQIHEWKETLEDLLQDRGDLTSLAHLVIEFEGAEAMDVLDHVRWKKDLPQKTDDALDEETLRYWKEEDSYLQFVFFTAPCYHMVVTVLEDDPRKLYVVCGLLGDDPLGVTDLARFVGPPALVTLPFQHMLTLICHLSWEASVLGHRTLVHECALADFQENNFWGFTEKRYWTEIFGAFSTCTTKLFRKFPLRFDELGEES